MKVVIASDHRGYKLKEELKEKLAENYEVVDLGTDSKEATDYPDYGFKIGEYVLRHHNTRGIAICGSGIGISIACNKVSGIRCAKVDTKEEAKITRLDNNSNVVAISGDMNSKKALEIVEEFLTTDFSKEERHKRRIKKISKYENKGWTLILIMVLALIGFVLGFLLGGKIS